MINSFPSLVGCAALLNALPHRSITSVGILAVAAGNVRQLIRVGFPVHRVREILPVGCLSH